MRERFIKIERPKGYVNIDEVYKALDNVEIEVDCEYGDFGEVLSKWATCDYDEVLDSISCCDVVKAIPLVQVKQAREEISDWNVNKVMDGCSEPFRLGVARGLDIASEILDKLIEEEE